LVVAARFFGRPAFAAGPLFGLHFYTICSTVVADGVEQLSNNCGRYGGQGLAQQRRKGWQRAGCVFLKSLDRFLLVKLISLSNYLVPY